MRYYFAPMEGITGYVFRRAHRHFFPGIEKYFTPFLAITEGRAMYTRDENEVRPEHNEGVPLVPQVLFSRGEDLLWAFRLLADRGYREINLNLGCPSATVVSRGRGAGMLADPDALFRLLDTAFSGLPQGMRLSAKTRLGMEKPEEFPRLLDVFNSYPFSELILHPRVRSDFYKRAPNRAAFLAALTESRAPVCYNGDLFCLQDIQALADAAPTLERAMLGRGLLADPGMLAPAVSDPRERLRAFHDALLEGYCEMLSGDQNVLYRMKELWSYLAFSFEDAKKPVKRMLKASRLAEYKEAAQALFDACPLAKSPRFRPW